MPDNGELAKMREEQQVMENWRTYARHVVADLLEGCAVCGTLREKQRLIRCRWCEDVYYCKEGPCAWKHQTDFHPAASFWTR